MNCVFRKSRYQRIEDCLVYKDNLTVTWINMDGIHQVEVLEKLGDCFGLHLLVLKTS